MIKKTLAFLGLALLTLAAVVLFRAHGLESRQLRIEPAITGPEPVDAQAAARRLAGAVRFRTISHEEGENLDGTELLGLHRYLEASFPRVHATLLRETVADYSLLYTWPGTDPELPPLLLLSHLDVVPVEPGTEEKWTHPPFSGRIADGHVWGRGTLDDKVSVLASLEAVELLLARGFEPERTVYLAFGHDEEVGGAQGAAALAALLESRGVRPVMILDEGGVIAARGMVPGVDAPVAMISTAEKGFVTLELTAHSSGGHSSMPPRQTAVGLIAEAVRKLERNPMPARIDGATRESFEFLAPEMPLLQRAVLGNLWLFEPLVKAQFAADPAADARQRTTTAVTMIRGGVKENVLPSEARAWVNFRVLPGDTVESVLDHVQRTVGPFIEVEIHGETYNDPSPTSSTEGLPFRVLQMTVGQVYPGFLVSPNLLSGGTDTKHYQKLSPNVYRFIPMIVSPEDLPRIHGTDERAGIEAYGNAVRFYAQLLRNTAGPDSPL